MAGVRKCAPHVAGPASAETSVPWITLNWFEEIKRRNTAGANSIELPGGVAELSSLNSDGSASLSLRATALGTRS